MFSRIEPDAPVRERHPFPVIHDRGAAVLIQVKRRLRRPPPMPDILSAQPYTDRGHERRWVSLTLNPSCEAARLQTPAACLKSTNELWAEISAKNPDFKKSIDAMQTYRSDQYLWWQVAEYTFDSFMIRSRTRG